MIASRRLVAVAWAILALSLFVLPAHGAVFGVKTHDPVSQPPSTLFSFGEGGGDFRTIGVVTLEGSQIEVDGLAVSPTHGLTGFRILGFASTLLRIDPATAVATPVGGGFSGVVRGACFDSQERLWVVDSQMSTIAQVNPLTGQWVGNPVALTLNGNAFTLSSGTDIAQARNGLFYLADMNRLYRVTPETGALLLVASQLISQESDAFAAGLAFSGGAPDTAAYVYDVTNTDDIYRYDTGSGVSALLYGGIVPAYNAGRGDLAGWPHRYAWGGATTGVLPLWLE